MKGLKLTARELRGEPHLLVLPEKTALPAGHLPFPSLLLGVRSQGRPARVPADWHSRGQGSLAEAGAGRDPRWLVVMP